MIDGPQDIDSITTFKRKSFSRVKRVSETGRPLDANGCQGISAQMDSVTRIRSSLSQVQNGLARPVAEVFDELEREA